MARNRAADPRRLDVRAFADAGATLAGDEPQAALRRFASSLHPMPGDSAPPPVHWRARGELRRVAGGAPQVWLRLEAQTTATLQCQRCLQPMAEALALDRWFRFADSEDEAARLDEESEDDVLVASRAFDLLELLEDELILALPLVPRHAACPAPLPMAATDPEADADADADADAAPHPFAALAALRRPPGGR